MGGDVDAMLETSRKERTEARNRVYGYIARHAGQHWREAQMKPWLLNLILSIEGEFEAKHSKQSQALGTLQLQHNLLQQKYTQETAASAERVKELEGRIKKMEEGLNSAAQARLEVELKLKECEDALRVAEEGAAHATEMCAQLNEAMMLLNANDTRLRKQLATRAYNLKESLLVANSRLRTKADDARKSRLETAALLKMKEAQMEAEVLSNERIAREDCVRLQSQVDQWRAAYDRIRQPWRMGPMSYEVVYKEPEPGKTRPPHKFCEVCG